MLALEDPYGEGRIDSDRERATRETGDDYPDSPALHAGFKVDIASKRVLTAA